MRSEQAPGPRAAALAQRTHSSSSPGLKTSILIPAGDLVKSKVSVSVAGKETKHVHEHQEEEEEERNTGMRGIGEERKSQSKAKRRLLLHLMADFIIKHPDSGKRRAHDAWRWLEMVGERINSSPGQSGTSTAYLAPATTASLGGDLRFYHLTLVRLQHIHGSDPAPSSANG